MMQTTILARSLLTPEQVADYIDVPVSTVRRFITSGVLDAYELEPGIYRIAPGSLAAFLAEHPWLCVFVAGQEH